MSPGEKWKLLGRSARMSTRWSSCSSVRPSSLGLRPLVAHCHLGLGRLYRRAGKSREAQEHVRSATSMYDEMDMRAWLEQAKAEAKDSGA